MRARLWIVLYSCVAVAALAAQQSTPASQQPTFRAGANYVRVDMYATEDGRPLDDLKADEIELREDGVLQKIDSVEHVAIRAHTPEEARLEPNTVRESRAMAADPRARVFVIFLDTYNTNLEGSARMREPLLRFLDRVLGPDDLVAVMTPEMSARDLAFARKTTIISNIVQNPWWGSNGRTVPQDETEALYDACYPGTVAKEMKARRREKLALDAVDDLITVLGGLREERKAVLMVSEGWMLFRDNPQLAAVGDPTPPQLLLPDPRQRPPQTGRGSANAGIWAQCEADRLALSQLDDSVRLLRTTEQANRGNVSFYTIYARGLVAFDSSIGPEPPPSPQQDAQNLRTKQEGLRLLADNSDGLAIINTNNINAAVDRIVADLSSYYLLGYYSTNTKLDGKFRSLSVKVLRPRVAVRARRGYRGLTANEVLTRASVTAGDKTADARTKPLGGVVIDTRAPFRIRASSWVAPTSGDRSAARIWLVGELDYRTRKELAWSAGAQADVAVVSAEGRTIMSKTIDVPATDGTFSIRVPESGDVPPGEYAVRVRLKSQTDTALPVSDVSRVDVPSTPSSIGQPVLWRRGPTTGVKYQMTADPRFMHTERLRLELPTRTTMPATAKLLDRTGRTMAIPVQVTERADAGNDFHWIVAEAVLAPLAAGDYAIEVTADGATQRTEFRVVP